MSRRIGGFDLSKQSVLSHLWRVRAQCLSLILYALFSSALNAEPVVDLIYSGNIDGELEPCGCSETGNMGGLKRHATVIDRLRAATPDVFAVSAGGLISAFTANEKLTAEYILKGKQALAYDAIGVQWSDLAYGEPFLRPYALPWVATNLASDQFAPSRTITKAGVKLAVFSWLDPQTAPDAAMHFGENRLSTDGKALVEEIRRAKTGGAVTVLLTTLPYAQVKDEFDLNYVDILFVKAGYEVFGEPKLEGRTLVLQPGSRGMRIGQVTIMLDRGNRIASFEHTVHLMPPDVPDAPRMEAWYAEYNAKVKAAYEESVKHRAIIDAGSAAYVGAMGCATCHQSQYKTWETTKHSGAYHVLMDVNKAFDPACIVCHTVGFGEEGGFVDDLLTKHLVHVQCENCHGAGRDHVKSAGTEPLAKSGWPKEQVCGQCHVPKHSPEFRLEEYWPRISH